MTEAKKTHWFTKGVAIFCSIGLLGAILGNCSGPSNTTTPVEPKKDRQLSGDDIAVIGVYGKTQDALRDPRSFELIFLGVRDDEKNAKISCMEFRSRNGFGGMVKGYSVWRLSGKDFTFGIDKPELWNKYCAKKEMRDKTPLAQGMIDRMKK